MCFDVLEHIFISDLKNVITDIYNYTKKLVIIKDLAWIKKNIKNDRKIIILMVH